MVDYKESFYETSAHLLNVYSELIVCNGVFPKVDNSQPHPLSKRGIPRNGFIFVAANFETQPIGDVCLFQMEDPDYFCNESETVSPVGGYVFEGLSFFAYPPTASFTPIPDLACIRYTNKANNPYRPIFIEKCSCSGFYSFTDFAIANNNQTILGFIKMRACTGSNLNYFLSCNMGKTLPDNYSSTSICIDIKDCSLSTANGQGDTNSCIYGFFSGNIIIENNDFEGTFQPVTIYQTVSPTNIVIRLNYWEAIRGEYIVKFSDRPTAGQQNSLQLDSQYDFGLPSQNTTDLILIEGMTKLILDKSLDIITPEQKTIYISQGKTYTYNLYPNRRSLITMNTQYDSGGNPYESILLPGTSINGGNFYTVFEENNIPIEKSNEKVFQAYLNPKEYYANDVLVPTNIGFGASNLFNIHKATFTPTTLPNNSIAYNSINNLVEGVVINNINRANRFSIPNINYNKDNIIVINMLVLYNPINMFTPQINIYNSISSIDSIVSIKGLDIFENWAYRWILHTVSFKPSDIGNELYIEIKAINDFNFPYTNSILPSIQVSAANAYILNQNVDKDVFNGQNRYLIRPFIPKN